VFQQIYYVPSGYLFGLLQYFSAISLERTNQQIITRTDLLNSWPLVSDWENVVHTRFVLTGKKYLYELDLK